MERVSFPYVSPVTQSCCLQDEKENCFAKEVCAPQDAKGDDAARVPLHPLVPHKVPTVIRATARESRRLIGAVPS